jgi:SAM-dependent methyltransferase
MQAGIWLISRIVMSDLRDKAPKSVMVAFTCNICGTTNPAPASDMVMGRESGPCSGCGSNVRLRAVVRLLSLGLFGKALPLAAFPVRPDLVGWGVSDWHGYAHRLPDSLSYTATYLDRQPHMDITMPPSDGSGTLDFLIATDVFEHVAPPVQAAFDGAARLLKPGGMMVFSVPFSIKIARTEEHYPELHEFHIADDGNGTRRLHNRTRDGRQEIHDRLKFHGGEGFTLEMRKFAFDDLLAHFDRAGFDVTLHGEDAPEWGIVWTQGWSIPMLARKRAN